MDFNLWVLDLETLQAFPVLTEAFRALFSDPFLNVKMKGLLSGEAFDAGFRLQSPSPGGLVFDDGQRSETGEYLEKPWVVQGVDPRPWSTEAPDHVQRAYDAERMAHPTVVEAQVHRKFILAVEDGEAPFVQPPAHPEDLSACVRTA